MTDHQDIEGARMLGDRFGRRFTRNIPDKPFDKMDQAFDDYKSKKTGMI
jgi:hypothetical protein